MLRNKYSIGQDDVHNLNQQSPDLIFTPVLKADNESEQPSTPPAASDENNETAASGPVEIEEDTTQAETSNELDTTTAANEAEADVEGLNTPMTDKHISDPEDIADDDAPETEHPQDNSDIHESDDTFNNENDQGAALTVDGQVEPDSFPNDAGDANEANDANDNTEVKNADDADAAPEQEEASADIVADNQGESEVAQDADANQTDVKDKENKRGGRNRDSNKAGNNDKTNKRQPQHYRNRTDEDPQQIKIDKFFSYNTTTSNQFNYKFVGGVGGKDFSVQNKNSAIHKIKFVQNMKRVVQMYVTFFDDKTEYKFGSSLKDIREYTEFTSEFEFYPGEYLKGDMIIATNSDTLTVKTRDVGQIYFSTVFGRTFEAGNRKQATKDPKQRFNVEKHFLSGVFGRARKQINSLGFLLYKKISTDEFDNLKFPEYDSMKINVKDKVGETIPTCNDTDKQMVKNIKQPHAEGEYRAVFLDHPQQNLNYLKYKKEVAVPSINKKGLKIQGRMSFSDFVKESNSFKNFNADEKVTLGEGQCAKIKQSNKTASQDNIPFNIRHKFSITDETSYSYNIILKGYTSWEKMIISTAEVIIQDKVTEAEVKKYKINKEADKAEKKIPSQKKEDKEVKKTPSQKEEVKKTPSQKEEVKKTPSQKEEVKKTPSQRKEGKNTIDDGIPSPVFKQNVLTKDSEGRIMKGGSEGAFFSNQIARNIISSLKVHSTGEEIKRIAIQFFNKDQVFIYGSQDVKPMWSFKEIEFEQGEYLMGNLIIASSKKDDSVGYISFQTIYGQSFEVGNRNTSNLSDSLSFNATKSFLSGIYGRESSSINSLGFILYKKMDDIVYDSVTFPELKKISFTINEQSGETKIQCNNSAQMKDVELSQPSASGEYRVANLEHPIISVKEIKFKSGLKVPTVDNEGKKVMATVDNLEEKSFNSTNVKVKISLTSGQCVQLKQSVKTAEHEKIKFTIKQSFVQDGVTERFAVLSGTLSFKKVIGSSVQPVFSTKS